MGSSNTVFFSRDFFAGHLSQTFRSAKECLPGNLRLAFIGQSFHESWYRKSLAIEYHKNPFDESNNEDANEPWKPPIRSCYSRHSTRASIKIKYSTVKCKHSWAVLVHFAKSLEKSVEKSIRNSKELTSIRWEQGRRCWRALKANESSWHSFGLMAQ